MATCHELLRRDSTPTVALLIALSLSGSLLASSETSDPAASQQESVHVKPPESAPLQPSPTTTPPQAKARLSVTVTDENGVGVASALITLTGGEETRKGETDFAGRWQSSDLEAGVYRVRIDREGFYAVVLNEVRAGETEALDVTLNHIREFVEVVNVVHSAPAIDPVETSARGKLNSQEIINVPFTVTRDIRYALPLMPGVLQDGFGQVHVNGSSTRQVRDYLDGFDVTDPVNGLFTFRVSADAVRSLELQGSRVPAEFGKGSGGILSLRTGMGDDRFRFSATDFVPSFQNRKGININTWVPRVMISGPLRKGRAWFMDAFDAEYDLAIFEELPEGADRNPVWRASNLAKAQVNLTAGHILTASYLVNRYRARYAGLSPFDPLETTVRQTDSVDVVTVKDQVFLSRGAVWELGFAASNFRSAFKPMGDQPYEIRPGSTSGNYFASGKADATRVQVLSNVIYPVLAGHGRHELRAGFDLGHITSHHEVTRRPFSILREDGSLSREITYVNHPEVSEANLELSGYAQDRWHMTGRWLVEGGARLDWDDVVRRASLAPRLATTVMLGSDGRTKLTGGFGLYYDATSIDLLVRGLSADRFDLFYDLTGQNLVRPPVETTLRADPRALRVPRFVNWSVELQRRLPAAVYLQLQFIQRRGKNGWTYVNPGAPAGEPFSGDFRLSDDRRDRYDALEIIARKTIKEQFLVFASYARSAARSNAVLNFTLDSPLFSAQMGGPLPWDAPNRLNTWGYLPFFRKLSVAYWLDWRDGFPFALVNENQQLVGTPGSQRFPPYFSLNLHLERRLRLLGFEWALRGGFNNITNHQNPMVVNNNVDSPDFLTFTASSGRAFTGRIRLLGRK